MKSSLRLLILCGSFVLLVLFAALWLRSTDTSPKPDQATHPLAKANQSTRNDVSDEPVEALASPRKTPVDPAPSAVLQKDATEFERFNEWAARYLAATDEQRRELQEEGIKIAQARRVVLRQMIETNPRQAIENAVPPVLRQQLPAAIAEQLEERVNEEAFYGVLGSVPSAENPATPAYRREVQTSDGGRYRAFVYGRRLNQPTILTRQRTATLLDEQGFVSGRELRTSPAPPRDIVETCPVSGKTTVAAKAENGGAVSSAEVVVEAGGQFHFLCSGGHIVTFEDQLVAREGGNGGPAMPTSPPTATQSTGYKTNLLMRVAFPEARKGSVTEKEGHDLGKTVQDWFLDTSYGAMTFMTTVTPLLILPRSEAWYKDVDTSGSSYEVLTDARAAAKAAGFDPANYNFDTVIFTGLPGAFGGQAYVGGKGCWLKSGTGTGVACHEYGHNFGLMHANFWSTTNGSAIGGGTHVEYGDSFDTMGSANAGDYQYNAFEKNLLNWLPTALVNDVTTSGTYRIYQMDQPAQNPRLRYAIKTRKDADRDYWVDFRQLFTSNAWVQGGVFVHWSPWASSSSGSHLLDTTPGSIDGKTDATVVIGRTFSDLETGIHITPISKNATTPPSADVVVNLGLFPGNNAPVLAVGASATSVAANVAVNFTATATDADGDALSYAWDFGDKSFSTANSPTVSKSWATAGDYRVRCTVSDMKGKTTSSSVIVTVGSPGTFRIAGTITSAGQPLANVRVHNSLTGTSYREAYTDADGTYTLTRLAAGTYTVGTELYGYTLVPSGSASVTVGPNASGVNFTSTDQPSVSIALQDADCSEGTNTGSFRITRTGSTAAALTVSLYAPSGSATKGTDYTLAPDATFVTPFYTFTIPAGSAFLDVLLTASVDASVESYESATLELVPSTSYVIGTAAATLWIADSNTTNPLVRLSVSDRDADESGDPGQFIISR
ncbi:MAG: PKD domain-containing protein, partial [Verrucomicrobia bacterium]|nr:PKD domain-containing protein [Verrucomicrobiota bacterium]